MSENWGFGVHPVACNSQPRVEGHAENIIYENGMAITQKHELNPAAPLPLFDLSDCSTYHAHDSVLRHFPAGDIVVPVAREEQVAALHDSQR